mgnify:FL=1|jgi:hypothetical protein|tara:strand:- start:7217 stop:7489 length:273 start_codon:yes stop_codon:yes gene_type:complete
MNKEDKIPVMYIPQHRTRQLFPDNDVELITLLISEMSDEWVNETIFNYNDSIMWELSKHKHSLTIKIDKIERDKKRYKHFKEERLSREGK